MAEYDLRTVSGKARLAALMLILLSLLALIIGGLVVTSAVTAGSIGLAIYDLFVGALWIVGGIVGFVVSGRIRDGDHLMWFIGILIGIVVMIQTWGFFSFNPNKPSFGLRFSVLDAIAFLLALGMTLLLLFAFLDRDRARQQGRR